MAAAKNRNWIFAVLMAVLVPALAIHVSCVAVIGPGSWGSGMEQKLPRLLPAASNPAVLAYARQFAAAEPPESLHDRLSSFQEGLRGKVFWADQLPGEDLAVVATHEGPTWTEKQHFYLWRGGRQAGELQLAPEMILEQPALMKRGHSVFIVVGRWFSWYLPPLAKLSRYLRSYRDPALRPEFSLYLYPLPNGPLTYWGPGHTLEPSPDRLRAVLLRSGASGAGYYSMHLWEFELDRLETMLSLREADPGSGRSFEYHWSTDSRAIHITGVTGGFERRKIEPRPLDLTYLVGDDAVYDLQMSSGK